MRKRSVGINAFLNVLRSIVALIVPLITYPYVSRVLGAENLGKVNYVHSIISYFILISGLGISTYGIREGARVRDDNQKVTQLISECFSIAVIMTMLSYLVMILMIFFFPSISDYKTLFLIEGALVLFDTIGIEWVNTVFEDYLYITIRTIVVHIISILAIFVFIHERTDYYVYACITVGTTGLVSILNWFHCRKRCKLKFCVTNNTKSHIKPILVFFANKLAVSLYVNSDVTMIGFLIGDFNVGLYSVSVKVYTIVKSMIAAMYTVTIPRLASKTGNNDKEGFKNLFSKLSSFMTLAVFPAMMGLCMLAPNIILLLFGEEYAEAGNSLRILAIGIIFAIYGGIVSTVYNVTKGLEKNSLIATILAAAINISLNVVLIPTFKEVGAAVTTVIAELVTFLYCFLRDEEIRKTIDWKELKSNFLHAVIGCIEICVIVLLFKKYINSNLIYVCTCILTSVCVYAVTLISVKNEFAIILIDKMKNH